MAKPNNKARIAGIAGFLSGGRPAAGELNDRIFNAETMTLDVKERARMIAQVGRGHDPQMEQSANNDGLMTLLQTVTRDTAATKIINQQIETIAPEIGQAKTIMIPLIMAPNDLRHGKVVIQCTHPGLSQEQREQISRLITDFGHEVLRLAEELPKDIAMAKYGAGAAPRLIIPLSELNRQFNDPNNSVSTEALQAYRRELEQTSFFGLSNAEVNAVTLASEAYQVIEQDFEAELAVEPGGRPKGAEKPSYHRSGNDQEKQRALAQLAQKFCAAESMLVLDNPNVVQLDHMGQKLTRKKLRDKLKSAYGSAGPSVAYREQALVSLSVPDPESDEQTGHPLVMRLPAESVVPLFPPGNPSDHIGYFVALDEMGNPINVTQEMYRDQALPNAEREQFQKLFQAYGIGEMTPMYGQNQQLMASVYQRVVEAYLKAKLGKAGMAGLDIGTDNAVFQAMFARYCRQRRTRLLFVPKELVSYFCFRHNENGTGRSKLDDLRFVLSLRISLLMCRWMSAMNNAVDRRVVTINLPQGFRGNVRQFLADVQREAVRKAVVTPSLDPDEITRSVTSKSMTFKVTGAPGMQDLSIENGANERTSATPDTELAQDITNLLINGIDLTPSMMNMLSDAEYARSVTYNNIMLSRKVMQDQEVTCRNNDVFVQTFVSYSKPLRDKIAEILKEKAADDKDDSDQLGVVVIDTDKDSKKSAAKKAKQQKVTVDQVIASLHTVLPRPNIAPDKAQFEGLESFIQTVNTMIQELYGDDLVNGAQEAGEALASVRALVKMQAIRNYIENTGFAGQIKLPDLTEMVDEFEVAGKIRQALYNAKAQLDQLKKLVVPDDTGMDSFGAAAAPEQAAAGGEGDAAGAADAAGGAGDGTSDLF